MSNSLQPLDCSPPGPSVHGILQNTRVGCRALLQGIFPTQGSNPYLLHLLHWQAGSLPLALPGRTFRSSGFISEGYKVSILWDLMFKRITGRKNLRTAQVEEDCCSAAQPCLTPYNPTDCSPPGSWVHRILRARILE